MSALVPPDPGLPAPDVVTGPAPGLHAAVEDALASARRLWVRGRVLGPVPGSAEPAGERRWWERRRGKAEPPPPPPVVHLETRVSGHVLTAEAPLLPDGRFEVLFTTELPPARRGWRTARHNVTCLGQSEHACGVVLTPPDGATSAAVVILPLEYTNGPAAPQALAGSDSAAIWADLFRRLEDGPGGRRPLYFLGCVPADGQGHQAELALAAT